MKLTIIALLLASVALAADPQPTAKDELGRVWTAYQGKLAESIKPHSDAYLKALEKLEGDAMRSNDTIAAAAIRKERDSGENLGLAALAIPDKKTTPQLTELKRLRADYDRKRDDAIRALNTWCQRELEIAERAFMERKDPIGANAIRVEREAVSKPPLQVVRASYGAGKMIDVALPLRKNIRFNRIETAGGNNLAGDPAPYQRKGGSVTFRLGSGQEKSVGFGEAGTIKIP